MGKVKIKTTGGTANTHTLSTAKVNQVGSGWFQTKTVGYGLVKENPQELALKLG